MIEHTAHAFDIDLQALARKIAEMGGLAAKQISDAAEVLANRDLALASEFIWFRSQHCMLCGTV